MHKAGAKNIVLKLHVNRRHASATELEQILVNAGGEDEGLPACADEAFNQCAVCQAFEKAPNLPVAGTSSASANIVSPAASTYPAGG